MKHFICLLVVVAFLAVSVSAQVPVPSHEFYGKVVIDNSPAAKGTRIIAHDGNGNLCGSFIVRDLGNYGFMSCNIKLLSRSNYTMDHNITFFVSGLKASAIGDTRWKPGTRSRVNLVVGEVADSMLLDPGYREPQQSLNSNATVLALILIFVIIFFLFAGEGGKWR